MKKYILSLALFLLILTPLFAQQWSTVGYPNFAGGSTPFVFSAVSPGGELYVAYRDTLYGKATVKKYSGSNWVTVGNAGFTAGDAYCTTMAFDNNGTPYVAYMDRANNSRASVMRFNGSNWEYVGIAGFTPGGTSYTSIAIDKNNTPYVAFRDQGDTVSNSWPNGFRASVMKFDGANWVYVGSPGFSGGTGPYGALYTSLAIDKNGTLYVAYCDMSNNFNAAAMKFDGSNWVYVGSPGGFSTGGANNTSIVIDTNGTPYVGFEDNGYGSKATVKKFNGTDWAPVGTVAFSPGAAEYPSLGIDRNNKLYLAFEDYGHQKRASVMTYTGTAWHYVGAPGFSDSTAQYTTIAIDKNNGILYTAYEDVYNENSLNTQYNITAMKYVTSTGINETKHNSSLAVYPNPTPGIFQINYCTNKKCDAVLKILNAKGEMIFSEKISSAQNEFRKTIDLSNYAKEIYFIEIENGEAREVKRVVIE